MRLFFSILLITFSLQTLTAQIPGRYKKFVFDSIIIHKDIQYGEADFYDANSNHDLAPLYLDFYEPKGDNLSARPLVITIFGGAFIGGNKEWDDMRAWCDSLSRYGYTCASIQYRLAFNAFNQESIIRASYRAVQDTRAAIRFLTENASTYRLDSNKIFLVGNSAGSITALLTAFITKDSERPPSTFGLPGTTTDMDDLGCLDCSGNDFVHGVKPAGIISLWGGMWDINWIEADEKVPSLLIHGTADGTVPYDTGYAFGVTLSPFVYGSVPIDREMTRLDIPHEFHPFDSLGHSFYMANGGVSEMNQYWKPVFTLGHEFLYKVVTNTFTSIQENIIDNEVNVYPNPATAGFIFLNCPDVALSSLEVWMTNLQGMNIQTWELAPSMKKLDVSNIPRGVYILNVRADKKVIAKKIVVI